MGTTRGERIADLRIWGIVVLAVLLGACSGSDPRVLDLLLSPDDFPDLPMVAGTTEVSTTAGDQLAAQLELSGPGFSINHSLVLFDTEAAALAVLSGIKEEQLSQSISPVKLDGFRNVSGVLAEDRGGNEALTVFFVEDRALVRITIFGDQRSTLLPVIAETARLKASGK